MLQAVIDLLYNLDNSEEDGQKVNIIVKLKAIYGCKTLILIGEIRFSVKLLISWPPVWINI